MEYRSWDPSPEYFRTVKEFLNRRLPADGIGPVEVHEIHPKSEILGLLRGQEPSVEDLRTTTVHLYRVQRNQAFTLAPVAEELLSRALFRHIFVLSPPDLFDACFPPRMHPAGLDVVWGVPARLRPGESRGARRHRALSSGPFRFHIPVGNLAHLTLSWPKVIRPSESRGLTMNGRPIIRGLDHVKYICDVRVDHLPQGPPKPPPPPPRRFDSDPHEFLTDDRLQGTPISRRPPEWVC